MTSQNDISRLGEFSSAEEIAKREKFRRKLLEKARLRDEEWQRRTAVYREKNIQDLPGYWKITGVANTPNTAKELSPLKRIKNSCADVRSDNTGGCTQEVASAPIEKTESATGKGHAGRLTFHLERHGRTYCNDRLALWSRDPESRLLRSFPAKINGEERTIDCSDLKQLQALEAGTNLTDAGRETAKRVESLFHEPDNFYISGLPRTAETAECHYQPKGVVYDDPSELEGHYILSDGSVIPFKKHPAMNEGFSGSNNLSDRVLLADLDRDLKNPNVSEVHVFSHGNRLRTLLRKLKDRLPPELAGEVNTDRPLRNCEVYTFELRDGTNEATEGSPEPFDFTWSKEVEEEQYHLEAEFHRREEKREVEMERQQKDSSATSGAHRLRQGESPLSYSSFRQSPTSSISGAPVIHLPCGASSETHHLSEEKEITSIAIVPSAEDPSLLGSSPSSAAFPLETSPESGYGDTKEQNTKDTATSWSALITPVITPLSTVGTSLTSRFNNLSRLVSPLRHAGQSLCTNPCVTAFSRVG